MLILASLHKTGHESILFIQLLYHNCNW